MNKIFTMGIIGIFLGTTLIPFVNTQGILTDSPPKTSNEVSGIYFVIGIGIYIEGGTWPAYEFIAPVFLIRLGKPSGPHILTHYSGESIDFMEGDKFLGYYPFLNPIHIGFVCGIWIDVESRL